MEQMIAYCGLECTRCPAYLATQADDDEMRDKAAAYYNRKFGFNITRKDINCDGCKSTSGRKLAYCQKCNLKKCAEGKKIDNCSFCDDSPCDNLGNFHKFSPEAKESFETLKNKPS